MKRLRLIAAVLAVLVIALAVFLVVRGGTDDAGTTSTADVPGGADPDQAQVVVDWARAESSGDNEAAAAYFAVPSLAKNGFSFHINDAEDAQHFNASLPCGAVVQEATEEGRYLVVTFLLGEKANSNACGDGAGHTARTAFLIEDGKIVEWRRVADESGRPAPSASA